MSGMRLNQFLAHAGLCSRRKAEQFIRAGAIQINGKPMVDLAYRVSEHDVVTHRGTRLTLPKKVYLLLNKPIDTITSLQDPEGRQTVMDLLPKWSGLHIYPVGRLDYKTTGLLLLTNDGPWAQALAHPSHKVPKVYAVHLNQRLAPNHAKQLCRGVQLIDGPAAVDRLVAADATHRRWHVTLHIGKNRMVRRLFQALGYTVVALDRIGYGVLTKGNLALGKWRHLTPSEVAALARRR